MNAYWGIKPFSKGGLLMRRASMGRILTGLSWSPTALVQGKTLNGKYQLISFSLGCKSEINICDQSLKVDKHPIYLALCIAA